jgi:hypothetical protein
MAEIGHKADSWRNQNGRKAGPGGDTMMLRTAMMRSIGMNRDRRWAKSYRIIR